MTDALPPQDLNAEKSLLGSILLAPEKLDDVADLVRADSFYLEANQAIFRAAESLWRDCKAIDAVTLSSELERRGELENSGGDRYLCEILDFVPHPGHARHYATVVKEKWVLRSLQYLATYLNRLASETYQDSEEVLTHLETRLQQIRDNASERRACDITTVLVETMVQFEEKRAPRICTGFTDLDERSGGLPEGGLIILAARPSVGKTAFCGCLLVSCGKRGIPAALLSLEQSRTEIAERMLASESDVSGRVIRLREFDEAERQRVVEGSGRLGQLALWIDDAPSQTVSQIGAMARRLQRKHGLKLLIVDYLQLIQPEDKRATQEQQVAGISRAMKLLARQLEIPVVVLAQLNRDIEGRENKRPRLSDLRSSGALEQDADMVLFLDRPSLYDKEANPERAVLIIGKNRHGECADIALHWDARTTTFRSMSHGEQMAQFEDGEMF